MENLRTKEIISSALLGFSGFVAPFSLLSIILVYTDTLSRPVISKGYLIPTFLISLLIMLYCIYTQRAIKKYKRTKRDSV